MLGTLLHEAAHGVATARQIQDTSRQGRFHNTRYHALAGELSLAVAKTGTIGWSVTTVPDATAALYRAELRRLDGVLVAYRHAEAGNGRGGRASSNNGVAARRPPIRLGPQTRSPARLSGLLVRARGPARAKTARKAGW